MLMYHDIGTFLVRFNNTVVIQCLLFLMQDDYFGSRFPDTPSTLTVDDHVSDTSATKTKINTVK